MKSIVNNKFVLYVMIFLLSLCMYFLGYLLRHFGLVLSFAFLSTSYFVLTAILLKKYENKLSSIGIIIALMLVFVDIPMRIVSFNSTLISLPDLLGRLIAIVSAYIYVKQKRVMGKIITAVLVFGFVIVFSVVGYHRYVYLLKYGTIKGKIEKVINQPVILQNDKGENILLSDMRGKYIILDFWSSTCGICYRQFPTVQTVYDKYKTAPNVYFYSVFWEGKGETIKTGSDILTKKGYTFPVLSIKKDDPILKEIGVSGVPVVVIFDPSGKLIFRGDIISAIKFLEDINSIIR